MTAALPSQTVIHTDGSVTLPLRKVVSVEIRDRFMRKRSTRFEELRFQPLRDADIAAVVRLSRAGDGDGASLLAVALMLRLDRKSATALVTALDRADESDCIEIGNYQIAQAARIGGMSEEDIEAAKQTTTEASP
ncbi:hypothetical protein VB618_09785 [Microvirga sp. CF3062]|uniref:hypothetical protein n=1 Tax=Microvirga sp. CF3062 TaxID=3110182 RepID=UPI002E7934BD|nr:hypothetical protein [Microvirga sp. CF3062]MEE1656488.1 hypothetical protein [Microvirga sp. CF3062]